MRELVFVTGNENKFEEVKDFMSGSDYNLTRHKIDLPEIQGNSEEIAKWKAREAFKILKIPCFVEDISLGFKAWNWLPGPYIKHFIEQIGVEKFEDLLEGKDKTARVVCTIGYAVSEDEVYIIQGEVQGTITSADPSNKFQFDRIFIPDGYDKRFSEISIAEKNKTSHRGIALVKFKKFLDNH